MKTFRPWTASFAGLLALVSCSRPPQQLRSPEGDALVGILYPSKGHSSLHGLGAGLNSPYVEFARGHIKGYDGCDSFEGTYRTEGDRLITTKSAKIGRRHVDLSTVSQQLALCRETDCEQQVGGRMLHVLERNATFRKAGEGYVVTAADGTSITLLRTGGGAASVS